MRRSRIYLASATPELVTSPNLGLGPGAEFDLVRAMLRRWDGQAIGVGDDAAVLDIPAGERLVVSTDASLDGVHFRREWLTPREIGARAAAAALSDLAAMAATPRGILIALALPADWVGAVEEVAAGIGEVARATGTWIVGGDITRAEQFGITCTVLGSARSPVRRDGLAAGDHLYVTGVLGGPSAALRALERGEPLEPALRERFARPRPRLGEALWLAQHGVHAMIDISDGLASELRHLAEASGLELRIDVERIPVMRGCTLSDATTGGEEYELLVGSPHALDVNAFARSFALPLSDIGRVHPAEAAAVIARRGDRGARVDLGVGHDHFS